jgi:hypothetical protein
MPTMAAITIIKLDVVSRRQRNGLPSSGWVEFSDGKYYHWSRDPEDEIFFSSSRKRHDTWEHFTINSPKRAKIVEAYLNTHNVETKVFNVRFGV